MPATNNSISGIATLGTVVPGTGYTNGTYENVPLVNLTGSNTGTGARGTVVIAATVLSSVTVTNKGDNYVAGDTLTFDPAYAGGTGTGASVPVATVADAAGAYGSLPSGHTYVGILIQTILTAKPFAGIMVRGTVNPAATPYSMTSILTAFKTAVPLIDFRED
jgi:hypothetical protein